MTSKKILLDTNIIIHRESHKVLNDDIGKLFYWIDKIKAEKYIHPVTIREISKLKNKETKSIFNIKLEAYQTLITTEKLERSVEVISNQFDKDENDKNDTLLLNEVFKGTVDLLITEDKKIHSKARELSIADKVFTIESFIEIITAENPDFTDYKVLSVKKSYFGKVNINDSFFDSFKEDYLNFKKWFLRKSNEPVYVSLSDNDSLLAFLYLKVEGQNENYSDIDPPFVPKRRLKIGTFKVVLNGFKLGERFLKIVFENAIKQKVNEIYVTIFPKREEQLRLIRLLEEWGFTKWGTKTSTGEEVYVRDFTKKFDIENPKITYPFISLQENNKVFIVPIWPGYHTELLPDSILRTESTDDFKEDKPHRNAISKVYISRSLNRDIKKGDIVLFYRTAEKGKSAHYSALITSIGIVEDKVDNIQNEQDFIMKAGKRSIFTNKQLKDWWDYNPNHRPFLIYFLHVYSLTPTQRTKLIRKKLLELGILTGEDNELRGLKEISKENFKKIIKEANIDESYFIY